MSSDFRGYDDDAFEETPDWLLDDDSGSDGLDGDADEFDQLRRKSAGSGSLEEDEMENGASASRSSGGSFSWSSFTPGQRMVLALLVVLDIFAIIFLVLVFTGSL
jgi:hypothetical protein